MCHYAFIPEGQDTLFRCRIFLKLALMGLHPGLGASAPPACLLLVRLSN
jgi:hypothetical protein